MVRESSVSESVRKHRAPKGALRLELRIVGNLLREVRKHRAPKGALRRGALRFVVPGFEGGQKAPSAKRCIKTNDVGDLTRAVVNLRKHRAPKGALRPQIAGRAGQTLRPSESTERQKVH